MKKNSDKISFWSNLKAVLCDERTMFVFGLVVLLVALYATIAMISFFFTGANDYSAVQSGIYENVTNWTGILGAKLSDYLINSTFGIASFALVWFFWILGLKLMKIRVLALWKAFLSASFLTIWLSIMLDFAFASLTADWFVVLGGSHGILADKWLKTNIGSTGTLLLLVATALIFVVLAFAASLPAMRRIFAQKTQAEPAGKAVDSEVFVTKIDSDSPEITEQPADPEPDDTPTWEFVPSPPIDEPNDEMQNDENQPLVEQVDTTSGDEQVDENLSPLERQGPYDPTADLHNYRYPTLDLLKDYGQQTETVSKEEQEANQRRIVETLRQFGIGIQKIIETIGPTITLYEIVPDAGVKISKIRNLEADIMLSLAARGIRIIAPIPGKGTIGIEVPNSHPRIVPMRGIIGSKKFQESAYELPVALGRTITNEVFTFDLAKMPHLLVAGATGQGKSVGLNAIITSLLYKKHPAQLKFVLVDPKKVEFNIYADIERHFLAKLPENDEPVITEVDEVKQTLNSLCKEMDSRYDLLKKAHVRNIKEYNEKFINRNLNPENGHRFLPYIVVVIDEFGDLIMTAGREVELPIARIAQLARAVGMHMIIATQRPSVNIITGIIKANFPARLAFKTSSAIDSKTILDANGANQLIGRGDLLFSQGNDLTRVQCALIETPEVEALVNFVKGQPGYPEAFPLPEPDMPEGEIKEVDMKKIDPLFAEAARWIVQSQQGSTSMVQRKFEVGFNRAGRIMDQLEKAGVVGPVSGSKPRQVLVHTEMELESILRMWV